MSDHRCGQCRFSGVSEYGRIPCRLNPPVGGNYPEVWTDTRACSHFQHRASVVVRLWRWALRRRDWLTWHLYRREIWQWQNEMKMRRRGPR